MFDLIKRYSIQYLKFNKFEELGFRIIFTTRIGGTSPLPYKSLNLGYHTEDDNLNIRKNRKLIYDLLNYKPENIVYAEQTHSNMVGIVKKSDKGSGVYNQDTALKGLDGLIATEDNYILAAHFADCVPIYVFDKKTKNYGLLHAGWQGTYKNILLNALNIYVNKLKSNKNDIFVIIGPSISFDNYEVDLDLIQKFKNKFNYNDYYANKNDKYFLDLKKLNKNIAISFGIKQENIVVSNYCTFKDENLFYSYRRDKGKTGRMTAFISRTR